MPERHQQRSPDSTYNSNPQYAGDGTFRLDHMAYWSDKKYASKTLANIKRQQWADYKARYPAIHQEYLDMAMSPDFTLEQVDRVEDNVRDGYRRAEQNQTATLSRMGVEDKAQPNGLAESLSVAHGENATRQHGKDRQMNALAGGQFPTLQTQSGG